MNCSKIFRILPIIGFIYILGVVGNCDCMAQTGNYHSITNDISKLILGAIMMSSIIILRRNENGRFNRRKSTHRERIRNIRPKVYGGNEKVI